MKTLNRYLAKLIILIFVFSLSCFQNIFAQGNNWKLDGNNNILPKDFIGTKNAADFNIRTNDTLRMKVTKKGDVEISGLLKVGSNTLTFNGAFDQITSDDGMLNLGGEFDFWDIKVGIGTQTPFATLPAIYGLDVNGDINITDANHWLSPIDNYTGHGYRIKGITVLQTQREPNGNSHRNIFVGENIFAFVNYLT